MTKDLTLSKNKCLSTSFARSAINNHHSCSFKQCIVHTRWRRRHLTIDMFKFTGVTASHVYLHLNQRCAPTNWWSAAALGGLMTGGGVINLCVFYRSCPPDPMLSGQGKTLWCTQRGGYGGSNPPLNLQFVFQLCMHKNTVQALLLYLWNSTICRKT